MMETLRKLSVHRIFFCILIFFLPTQLGFHFWPEWSMVLGRRVDYLSPTLFLTDIFLVLTILMWVFEQLHNKRLVQRFKTAKITKKTILFTSFLLGIPVYNIFFATAPELAVYGWIKILEIVFLILYIVKTKPSLQSVTRMFIFTMVCSVFLGILQMKNLGSLNGVLWFFGERTFSITTPNIAKSVLCIPGSSDCFEVLRPYATFSHPNVFAGFLVVTILFSFMTQQFKNLRSTRVSLLGVLFLGLALTISRSGWLGMILSVGILFRKRRRIVFISLILCVATMLLTGIISPASIQKNDESVVVRNQLNHSAISIIKHHPWTGVGVKNFLPTLPSYLPTRTIYFLQPVHNIYLLIVSEFGIPLVSLLLFTIYRWKKAVFRVVWYPPLLALLCIGLLDHYPLTIQQGTLLLGVVLGFALMSEL